MIFALHLCHDIFGWFLKSTGPQNLFENFAGPQPKKVENHWSKPMLILVWAETRAFLFRVLPERASRSLAFPCSIISSAVFSPIPQLLISSLSFSACNCFCVLWCAVSACFWRFLLSCFCNCFFFFFQKGRVLGSGLFYLQPKFFCNWKLQSAPILIDSIFNNS